MNKFIELHAIFFHGSPFILNADKIETICVENGTTKIYTIMREGAQEEYAVKESYDEVKAMLMGGNEK